MVIAGSIQKSSPLHDTSFFLSLLLAISMACSSSVNAQQTSDKPKIMLLGAPAVVGIETGKESGSGFFFRPDGWLITNYHVVSNAPIDKETARPFVRITYGMINEKGAIIEGPKNLWASVYRVDRRSDLALLLLDALPEGETSVPFIPFAKQAPQPGDNCFAIGMPLAGMKWDLRPGAVSSQGIFPNDVTGILDSELQLSPQKRDQLMRRLAPEGKVDMIATTCGINPGDSGGPVLNEQGELIAVTRSIPKSSQEGISYDKFAYHVHLSEIVKFVEPLPTEPELPPPLLLPLDSELQIKRTTNDLAIRYNFANKETLKSTVCIDLNPNASDFSIDDVQATTEKTEREFWNALGLEWAILKSADEPAIHFFDLNQDGQFELVFQSPYDEAGFAIRYSKRNGKWRLNVCDSNFLSEIAFKSVELQSRFESLKAELELIYTK